MRRNQELSEYAFQPIHGESDEDAGSESPIVDGFRSADGPSPFLKMTNFSEKEFDTIWTPLNENVKTRWNVGAGRKSPFKSNDIFFMLLKMMKHGGKWDFLASIFKMKGPTFKRTVMGFLGIIAEHFHLEHVNRMGMKYSMTRLEREKTLFKTHPHEMYATDVTFQQANRRTCTHQ